MTTPLTTSGLLAYAVAHGAWLDLVWWLRKLDPAALAEGAWAGFCSRPDPESNEFVSTDDWEWMCWLACVALGRERVARCFCDLVEAECLPNAGSAGASVRNLVAVARRFVEGSASRDELRDACRAMDEVDHRKGQALPFYYADAAMLVEPVTCGGEAWGVPGKQHEVLARAVYRVAFLSYTDPCALFRRYFRWDAIEAAIAAGGFDDGTQDRFSAVEKDTL